MKATHRITVPVAMDVEATLRDGDNVELGSVKMGDALIPLRLFSDRDRRVMRALWMEENDGATEASESDRQASAAETRANKGHLFGG